MEKIDFIWFIEHISRELDVAAAVSVMLKKKFSKKIKILPYNSLQDFKGYSPSVVLLPYCYSIFDQSLSKCLKAWPNSVYINLAWEQIFYQANLEYKAPRDIFTKKFVIHHAWSNKRKKFLMEKGVIGKNIFVNGHPAYRLYQEPYRSIFVTKKELAKKFNLDYRKKWLFFPENFSWFFYSNHNLENIIKNGQKRNVVYSMKNYCGKALSIVLNWLNKAAEIYQNEFEIILRPRPAFSLEYFQNKINELNPSLSSNIRIIKDYSVREWILASNMVISSFSTSLIEAAVAQKNVYMLEPVDIPDELSASWYELVPKIKTKNSFMEIFKDNKPDKSFIKLGTWAKKEFFVTGDSIKGLVNFLSNFEYSNFSSDNIERQKIIEITKVLKPALGNKLINVLGEIKRNLLDNTAYFQNDDQKLYEEEIKRRVNEYQNSLNV